MYTIKDYTADIKALTNSIVIKINEMPMVINAGVKRNLKYTIEHDPNNQPRNKWKYYLNLAGIMHPLDTPVYIQVIETDKKEVLTAELLNKYPLTKTELSLYDKYYNILLKEYPEHVGYINGCINPVDIEQAIEAKEGSILAYSKKYVQYNEYYLIPELEAYIKRLLARWHVKPYSVTDELYVPSLLSFLISAIFLKIINLRLSKINTYQVHSFHLEHFFRSRMELWDDIYVLNKKSLFWLYNNLDVMLHNVGKELTFKKIYQKLLLMNNVGLGVHDVSREDPVSNHNKKTLTESSYKQVTPVTIMRGLNKYFVVSDGKHNRVDDILDIELDTVRNTNKNIPPVFKRYIRDSAVELIDLKHRGVETTKILDLDSSKLLEKTSLDVFSLVIDYWVYSIQKDIEYSKTHKDDKDQPIMGPFSKLVAEVPNIHNRPQEVSSKGALLIIIKLLLFALKQMDMKISGLNYYSVSEVDVDKYQFAIDNVLIKDDLSYGVIRTFKDLLPGEPEVFKTFISFRRYMKEVIDFSKYLWVFMANSQDFMLTTNIKRVFKAINKQGTLVLTDDVKGKTIDELLGEENIRYEVNQYVDPIMTIKKIITTFTGIELDQDDTVLNNFEAYKNILEKLTSYTLQTIGSGSASTDINAYYNNPTILTMKSGLAFAYGVDVKGLEENFCRLRAMSYERYNNMFIQQRDPNIQIASNAIPPIFGDLVVHHETFIRGWDPAGYSADFITLPAYDFDKYKWVNDWLKIRGVDLEGLERPFHMDFEGFQAPPGDHLDYWTFKPGIAYKKDILGDLVVKPGEWLNTDATYDFKTLPDAWFQPDTTKYLTVHGIEFEAIEDTVAKLKTRSFIHSNNTLEGGVLPIKSSLKFQADAQGDAVYKNPKDVTGTMSFANNYEVLNMTKFVTDTKYLSIGLMAFKTMNANNQPDNNLELITYLSEEAITAFPEISNNPSVITGRNSKLDIESSRVEVQPLDKSITTAVTKVLKKVIDDPTQSEVSSEFKDQVQKSITKTEALGLAMLPFRIIHNSNTTLSKLMYLGLIAKDGSMDVYDCSDVQVLTYNELYKCPVIKKIENTFKGYSSPIKDDKGNKILMLSVNLENNLGVNETNDIEKDNWKDVDKHFRAVGNAMIGKELDVLYQAGESELVTVFDSKYTSGNTLYTVVPFNVPNYDKFIEPLKVYAYSNTYVKQNTIPINVYPLLSSFDVTAIENKYYVKKYTSRLKSNIKFIAINGMPIKVKAVSRYKLSKGLAKYISSIDIKNNEYIFPNGVSLLLASINSVNYIIEINPVLDTYIVFEFNAVRSTTIQETILDPTDDGVYRLLVPNYVINSDLQHLSASSYSNYQGFYQIGQIEYHDHTGVVNKDGYTLKQDLVDKYGKEAPWLKNLTID